MAAAGYYRTVRPTGYPWADPEHTSPSPAGPAAESLESDRDIMSPEAPADAVLSEMLPAEGMTDDAALVVVRL